tara:strand:- start:454 stop:825 length:372 start_codon:yes stop_codon:yes gene_type:complete
MTNRTRERLAQSVLMELGEPQHPDEVPYYEYLHWETIRYALSRGWHTERMKILEQLILGPLDGEYGDEVLRDWSPEIRPNDWTASLLVRDSIPHSRKTAFGQWAQGLLRDMFHYGEASHVASI